jgi:hypothetical protein
VSVPVQNTGEAPDTFGVSLTDLPAGWTAAPRTVALAAGERRSVALSVTPDARAFAGTLRARAVSVGDPSVASDAPFAVSVAAPLPPGGGGGGGGGGASGPGVVGITYSGPSRFAVGDTVALSAVVRRGSNGVGEGGVPLTFVLSSGAARVQAFGTTGADGVGRASLSVSVPPGRYSLVVDAGATAGTVASSVTVPVTVDAQQRALTLLGLVPARFAARRGTTIRYRLARAATVDLVFSQLVAGRRSGARCVAATRKLRQAKKCTRSIGVGRFARASAAGQVSFGFSGRVGKRTLKPGAYEVTVTPRGAPADALRARFRVLAR